MVEFSSAISSPTGCCGLLECPFPPGDLVTHSRARPLVSAVSGPPGDLVVGATIVLVTVVALHIAGGATPAGEFSSVAVVASVCGLAGVARRYPVTATLLACPVLFASGWQDGTAGSATQAMVILPVFRADLPARGPQRGRPVADGNHPAHRLLAGRCPVACRSVSRQSVALYAHGGRLRGRADRPRPHPSPRGVGGANSRAGVCPAALHRGVGARRAGPDCA